MKKNDALLASGQWYFVHIRQPDNEIDKIIMDENEYSNFFRQLNGDGKFVDIRWVHYFWSNVHSFWPIVFESGVLDAIKNLWLEEQNHIRNRLMDWYNLYTMEKLRSEIAYFLSR